MAIVDERPSITLRYWEGLGEAALTEVLLGIEEEGVPCRVEAAASADAAGLAHEAALSSRLGAGIGAAPNTAVVTLEKLAAVDPYITQPLNADRATDRALGANAARLVKRLPLRPFGE